MAASKLRNAVAPDADDVKVDMSPMIDMVFLLLIFFIVNATAIIVKTDPEVIPPVAKNSKKQDDGRGRIVVNIRLDGRFTTEKMEFMKDDTDIFDYVKTEKERIQGLGVTPKLHLRGDKETVFKHSRTVIRAAAAAGVDQVIFAVFQTDKGHKR